MLARFGQTVFTERGADAMHSAQKYNTGNTAEKLLAMLAMLEGYGTRRNFAAVSASACQ